MSRDCDAYGATEADAGAAVTMVNSHNKAIIDTLDPAELPREAVQALLRLVCEAEQRAAARSTKGAA